jgi:hypothetical protein
MTSGLLAKGRFGKQDFVYVAADDVYLCPADEQLIYHYTNEEEGKTLRRYWTTACQACALKSKCTTGKERRISRWEHEAVLEAVQARLDRNPAKPRAPSNCGASLRYDKVLDGSDALPDENAQERRYRNGATRLGLQYEKGNQHSGRWWFDGGDPGLSQASVTSRACLPKKLRFHTGWVKGGQARCEHMFSALPPRSGHCRERPLCANSGLPKRARSANLKIISRSLTIHQCSAVSVPAFGLRFNVP